MEVTRYLFQSTSSSPVQVGTPDPSVKQEAEAKKQSEQLAKDTNTTLQKAETFTNATTQSVDPKVDTVELSKRVRANNSPDEIEATQETSSTAETTEVSDLTTQEAEKPNRNNIWAREGNSFDTIKNNVWSRSNQTNNVWADSNTGNFSNIWRRNNEDMKLQDDNRLSTNATNRFDFSSFSKVLDFFA